MVASLAARKCIPRIPQPSTLVKTTIFCDFELPRTYQHVTSSPERSNNCSPSRHHIPRMSHTDSGAMSIALISKHSQVNFFEQMGHLTRIGKIMGIPFDHLLARSSDHAIIIPHKHLRRTTPRNSGNQKDDILPLDYFFLKYKEIPPFLSLKSETSQTTHEAPSSFKAPTSSAPTSCGNIVNQLGHKRSWTYMGC